MLFLLCVFAVSAKQSCTVLAAKQTPVAAHGRLAVRGADLTDAKGRKFQLRGVSTHGINWDVGYPYVNKEAFQTLRDDWGAMRCGLSCIHPNITVIVPEEIRRN